MFLAAFSIRSDEDQMKLAVSDALQAAAAASLAAARANSMPETRALLQSSISIYPSSSEIKRPLHL
ncbi:hypothetical protein Mapa_007918 [Marchantia paleacea]|nr:hypothetical protein Mapa_007918 [Marchantia paleacea]